MAHFIDEFDPATGGTSVRTKHVQRRPIYDASQCFITVTENNLKGHHTPFWVQLPIYGKKFENDHPKMAAGNDKGLFYVPRIPSTTDFSFQSQITIDSADDDSGYEKYRNSEKATLIEMELNLITKQLKWYNDVFITKGARRRYDPEDETDPVTAIKAAGKILCVQILEL